MFNIKTYNQISVKGLDRFRRDKYEVASEIGHPDAYLLRSHKLHGEPVPPTLKAVARAGAGVNNIPVKEYGHQGIVVFNTPGANANAVKELVLAGLLLSARGIVGGMKFVEGLSPDQDPAEMNQAVEQAKKQFAGHELVGRTLGIVGLGAIGSMVADVALALGMEVVGYDPALSVEAAWRLSSSVKRMENLPSLMGRSDYITLHVPAIEETHHLVNAESLRPVKPGTALLNFARETIVDPRAVVDSLNRRQLTRYVCDFPDPLLLGRDDVIAMPHIGASTEQAEDNCAVMAANQLMDYLENGNIVNSVNFPRVTMDRTPGWRITFSNDNVAGVLGHVLSVLADHEVNVVDMLNRSRDDLAYNIIDVEQSPSQEVISAIKAVDHVIAVRVLNRPAA